LQSAYDPYAPYGHKGTGYRLHVTETCNHSGKTEIITDYEAHGAGRSDIGKPFQLLSAQTLADLIPLKHSRAIFLFMLERAIGTGVARVTHWSRLSSLNS